MLLLRNSFWAGQFLLGSLFSRSAQPGSIQLATRRIFFPPRGAPILFFGLLTAAIILLLNCIAPTRPAPERLRRWMAAVAGVTFTIYLLHYPAMLFIAAIIPDRSSLAFNIVQLFIVLLLLGLIGHFLEPTRRELRSYLKSLLIKFRRPRNQIFAA